MDTWIKETVQKLLTCTSKKGSLLMDTLLLSKYIVSHLVLINAQRQLYGKRIVLSTNGAGKRVDVHMHKAKPICTHPTSHYLDGAAACDKSQPPAPSSHQSAWSSVPRVTGRRLKPHRAGACLRPLLVPGWGPQRRASVCCLRCDVAQTR